MRLGVTGFFHLHGRRRRRRCRGGDRSDDAAEHAAGSTTSHAAGDATDHAATPLEARRKLFFLNRGDFFRDALGRHQAAGVELRAESL